jgi:hypothetical protein
MTNRRRTNTLSRDLVLHGKYALQKRLVLVGPTLLPAVSLKLQVGDLGVFREAGVLVVLVLLLELCALLGPIVFLVIPLSGKAGRWSPTGLDEDSNGTSEVFADVVTEAELVVIVSSASIAFAEGGSCRPM